MKAQNQTKTQILSGISNALSQYAEFVKDMDSRGLDFTGIKEVSQLAYTLEDCEKFIKETC